MTFIKWIDGKLKFKHSRLDAIHTIIKKKDNLKNFSTVKIYEITIIIWKLMFL